MKYHIVTFGCAQNVADSERIAAGYEGRGYKKAKLIKDADVVVINTCMIRESAENRVYGLVKNLSKLKTENFKFKIVVTGCMVGMAVREKTGKMLALFKKKLPEVDEFLPIEEVGFDHAPLRGDAKHALVPISNGCNNFCTYCVVPFTRGREVSRPFEEIIAECMELAKSGYTHITLVGQNVNSYGADIVNTGVKQVYVKHLGRLRNPTLFPQLLEEICRIKGIKLIDFISSNPWDFSDDLIDVIAKNPNVSRQIHLPVQSGDNKILRKMNRWYTRDEYIKLIAKLKSKINTIQLSTDIIVGFPGETEEQFQNTVDLCKKAGFYKAYISVYSDRPLTTAHKIYKDDVPHSKKKRRWKFLEDLINKPNLVKKQ